MLLKFKPTTPGLRGTILVSKKELSKERPHKSLTKKFKSTGGRNNQGRITSRRMGGGVKRKYRVIDFKRSKTDISAEVIRNEYDPNRSAFISLLKGLAKDSNSHNKFLWWAIFVLDRVCVCIISEYTERPTASRCRLNKFISAADAKIEKQILLGDLELSFIWIGKCIEEDRSITNWHLKLVSSSKRSTNNLSVRAYNFQSIFLVLSPVLYKRCSANSTENPW